MNEVQPLIRHLLANGGKDGVDETWYELAVKFEIGTENEGKPNGKRLRSQAAKQRWLAFLGTNRGLEMKSATFGKDGEISGFKMGRSMEPKEIPSTEGMVPKFITTTPNGGAFVRYENEKGELTRESILELIRGIPKKKHKHKQDFKQTAGPVEIYGIGDAHIGMSAEDNIFGLSWNREELFGRIPKLLDNVGQDAGKIYLVLGGDISDGMNESTSRGKHRLPQNLDDKGQLRTAVEFSLKIVDGITSQVECPVEVIFLCNSNHPGILDFAAGMVLQSVAESRWAGQVAVKLQEEFIASHEIAGRSFIMTHGYDSKHMKNGWPRFLAAQHEQFVERFIEHTGAEKPVLLRFDRHVYHDISLGKFRDILCPAWSNPSSWIQINFGANKKGGFIKITIDDQLLVNLIEF